MTNKNAVAIDTGNGFQESVYSTLIGTLTDVDTGLVNQGGVR